MTPSAQSVVAPMSAKRAAHEPFTVTPVTIPANAYTEVLSVDANNDVYFGSTNTIIPGFCLYGDPYTGSCSGNNQGLYRYSGGTVSMTTPRGPYFGNSSNGLTCGGKPITYLRCSWGNVSAIDASEFSTVLWMSDYTYDQGSIPDSEAQWGTGSTATVPPIPDKHKFSEDGGSLVVSILRASNGHLWLGSGGPVPDIYPAKLPSMCSPNATPKQCDLFFLTNGPNANVWAMTHTFTLNDVNPTGTAFFEFTPNGALLKTVKTSDVAIRVTGTMNSVWFTDYANDAIGRINKLGALTEYAVPTKGAGPYGITVGPDGAIWFAEYNASQVGRIDNGGHITEYAVPFNPSSIASTPPECKTGGLWIGSLGSHLAEVTL